MKPNDKAIEAARKVAYNRINKCFVFDLIKEAVDAAYAAQFQPSEDYAGLLSDLRIGWATKENNNRAAYALEAVLVERDAAINERDALLARLAPMDDEALVEIASKALHEKHGGPDDETYHAIVRCTLAAIRPHIEAAERERCAKAVSPMEMALEAAYAAQFPPSEDYAGLVKELRDWDFCWPSYSIEQAVPKAADALEALLAERDALKAERDAANGRVHAAELHAAGMSTQRDIAIRERDGLLARLAPVEDEELVEIAAYYFTDGSSWSALSERLRNTCRRDARNVIAAIRPHIEAAERERCAAALEITSDEIRLHAGEMTAQEMRSVLAVLAWRAAAIRSGK